MKKTKTKKTTWTKIHYYDLDISRDEDRERYERIKETLKGVKCFNVISDNKKVRLDGNKSDEIEVELHNFITDDQWNTKCGLRVFDWYEELQVVNKNAKQGHWVEINEDMQNARNTVGKCGYCGSLNFERTSGLCGKCFGGEYTSRNNLSLMLLSPAGHKGRRPQISREQLNEAEAAFRRAQVYGKGKMVDMRKVNEDYAKRVKDAENMLKGHQWLADNSVNTSNIIHYDHSSEFCLGWRKGIDRLLYDDWKDRLKDFPCKITVKLANDEKEVWGE